MARRRFLAATVLGTPTVAALLVSIAVLACALPRWRAVRIDPLAALRAE